MFAGMSRNGWPSPRAILIRIKHDYQFPINAVDYCLYEGRISAADLDYVGFYDKPLGTWRGFLDNNAPHRFDLIARVTLNPLNTDTSKITPLNHPTNRFRIETTNDLVRIFHQLFTVGNLLRSHARSGGARHWTY